jgi:transposase
MKRSSIHKHIYPIANGKYSIDKSIKGKHVHFKVCDTLDEAIKYRDRLIDNDWKPLPPTPEELEKEAIKKYYMYIQKRKGRYYTVQSRADKYMGTAKSIEEALWFRDLYANTPYEDIPKMNSVDLRTGNPYIEHGLKYPLPERLKLEEKTSSYGTGSIVKKGETAFHIHHGKKGDGYSSYVCACPTIEMAEYVKAEMNKVDWDRTQLQRILDDYPRYYTKLLFFYQYIQKDVYKGKETGKWRLGIPKTHNDGKLEHILYRNLEDALFERDFLKEHDWDYNLLVETINDADNPYYDIDLPTYPTRKIRNITERNYHEKELLEIADMVRQGYSQLEIIEMTGFSRVTIQHWLNKFWNSDWKEFVTLINNGENPLEVLEKQELIFQPDLSRNLPNNWNNWVSYLQKADRWQVRKGTETFGVYPTEKLAHKISNELQKVNWDRSKLKAIQAKYGHVSMPFSKRWVYKENKKWAVRRKDKNKKMITYGRWYDKRIAIIVRDMLLKYGFNLDNRDWIVEIAEWTVQMQDLLPYTMFGKSTLEDIEYIESSCNIPYCRITSSGKYQISKHINGKVVAYGTYSEDKAIEVVEFLMDNNWDKDLLKVMQEMGEI